MATFNELQALLGYDILNPLYQKLGGSGNPFMLKNEEGGADMLLGGNQASSLGFDPSFFDPYTFDWQGSGPGNSGTLTAFKDGDQVWQGSQYDTPFSETLRDAVLTAGAAFGGLGLAGAGPMSGLSSLGSGSLGGLDAAALDSGAGAFSGIGGASGAGGSGMLGSWGGWNIDPSVIAGSSSGSWIPGISNSSLLSVGGNLLSGLMGSNAADKASRAQLTAGREANALQKYMYDTARADFAPYREAGTGALGQIQALLKDPSSITQDPGYQFGLDEGTNALNRGAAARGMTYSGAQGKALQRYGQDYAGTKLNESYNRLANLAGLGQTATSGTTQAGMNYGNAGSNLLQSMGDARASGYMGGANAWGKAIGNVINDYNEQDALKRMGLPGGW